MIGVSKIRLKLERVQQTSTIARLHFEQLVLQLLEVAKKKLFYVFEQFPSNMKTASFHYRGSG